MSCSAASSKPSAGKLRSLRGGRIVLATGNTGKLREYSRLLAPYRITAVPADALGIPSPPETEDTLEGNARIKARHAMRKSGMAAIAEDSGLEVEALGNAPGVLTADWAEGPNGRDYKSAMNRIRIALDAADAAEPRRARFRAVICVTWPEGECVFFEGRVNGRLIWPPRGEGGFGYDPMFAPDGSDRTFAEMSIGEKSACSHRAAALMSLAKNCLDRPD